MFSVQFAAECNRLFKLWNVEISSWVSFAVGVTVIGLVFFRIFKKKNLGQGDGIYINSNIYFVPLSLKQHQAYLSMTFYKDKL